MRTMQRFVHNFHRQEPELRAENTEFILRKVSQAGHVALNYAIAHVSSVPLQKNDSIPGFSLKSGDCFSGWITKRNSENISSNRRFNQD